MPDSFLTRILSEIADVLPGYKPKQINPRDLEGEIGPHAWMALTLGNGAVTARLHSGKDIGRYVVQPDEGSILAFHNWLWETVVPCAQGQAEAVMAELGLGAPEWPEILIDWDGRRHFQGRWPTRRIKDMADLDWDGGVAALLGRPGSGKTMLTYRLARDFAAKGRKVLFLLWEQETADAIQRYMQMFGNEYVSKLRFASLPPESKLADFLTHVEQLLGETVQRIDAPDLIIIDRHPNLGVDVLSRIMLQHEQIPVLTVRQTPKEITSADDVLNLPHKEVLPANAIFWVDKVGGPIMVIKHRTKPGGRYQPQTTKL